MSTPETQPHPVSAQRSTFVTVVAWIFIVLAGFATLISLLQNVMVHLMFPAEQMRAAAEEAGRAGPLPWFAKFMMEHFSLLLGGMLALCLLVLAAAIGLLRRRNWARRLFVALMAFGIAWSVGATLAQFYLLSSFAQVPANAPAEFRQQFETMQRLMIGFTLVMSVVFTVLFAWIIKRLLSADVRREFLKS